MTISISEIFNFNSAHRLYNKNWDISKNSIEFGKCSFPNYHGHNYKLEVKISGKVDINLGYTITRNEICNIVNKEIIQHFDHKNLNIEIPQFSNLIPTVENIAIVIWDILNKIFENKYNLEVKLYETERNFVIYKG